MTVLVKPSLKELPWDAYLSYEVDRARETAPDQRARLLEGFRRNIDGFRRNEWPAIQRELRTRFKVELDEALEPHWVQPGKAVYWHEQKQRYIQVQPDGARNWVEESRGWFPTSPLPADNADKVYHYLAKGFRFRPGDGELHGLPTEQQLREADRAREVSWKAVEANYKDKLEREDAEKPAAQNFWCRRHDAGDMAFPTWKAYAQHCRAKLEAVELELPAEEAKRREGFKWYCRPHAAGFNNVRLATRHSKTRRLLDMKHPTLKEMEVR